MNGHFGVLTFRLMLGLMAALSLSLGACNRSQPPAATETPPATTPSPAPTPTVQGSPGTTTPAATPTPTTSPSQPTSQGGNEGTALNPPKPATLVAQQADAQINLRSRPSAEATAKGYGLVGDRVQLLRVVEAGDRYTWYYVKFNESGAEGWVRGDFIDTTGRGVSASKTTRTTQDIRCEGVFESTLFIAYYGNGGFNRIEFRNLETNATFSGTLRAEGENGQGQPVFVGEVSPPAGGSYTARLTDLSGGNPTQGSQVALDYAGIPATGECK